VLDPAFFVRIIDVKAVGPRLKLNKRTIVLIPAYWDLLCNPIVKEIN